MSENTFSHIDETVKPTMVDIGEKQPSLRTATALTIVSVPQNVLEELQKSDLHTKKGPVFQTAVIAGIMAAKKTGELIPLCHPLGLDNCSITIDINDQHEIVIECTTAITAKT